MSRSHQILFLMSDISSFSEGCVSPSSVAGVGSSAVQEAAMYRRLLLTAVLGLTLSACVPYYDGGSSYYRSEVYTAPAPVYYYGGGPSYQYRRGYYAPPPRYYSAPRYYQPAPRYYPAGPRAGYRPYPSQGWGDHRGYGGHGRGDGRGGEHGRGRGGHR
jgi:hypothetical protein